MLHPDFMCTTQCQVWAVEAKSADILLLWQHDAEMLPTLPAKTKSLGCSIGQRPVSLSDVRKWLMHPLGCDAFIYGQLAVAGVCGTISDKGWTVG